MGRLRLLCPVVLLLAACGGTPGPWQSPVPSQGATSAAPTPTGTPTGTPSPTPTPTPTGTAHSPSGVPDVGARVWVDVPVATLWVSPDAPRPVDAPAVAAAPDVRRWLHAMTTDQERGLVGRVETQALYGEQLVVTAVRGSWLHVVAPDQPTSRDSRGYPGWVPASQVTVRGPTSGDQLATVVSLTTWLRDGRGRAVLEVSLGTRLPVRSRSGSAVVVAVPGGGTLAVAASGVVVGRQGAAPRPFTASGVVATVRGFLGVPYLWGGRSGFAVDCSGLTELAYQLHGVVLPRDTGDQVRAGRAAAASALRPADLVFFGPRSSVTHVGVVVGPGQMVHAPGSGSAVQVASVGSPVAARRVG